MRGVVSPLSNPLLRTPSSKSGAGQFGREYGKEFHSARHQAARASPRRATQVQTLRGVEWVGDATADEKLPDELTAQLAKMGLLSAGGPRSDDDDGGLFSPRRMAGGAWPWSRSPAPPQRRRRQRRPPARPASRTSPS